MPRVLLTGMSGTGKSTVLAALPGPTVDLDDAWCVPVEDGRRLWDLGAVGALLDAHDDVVVAGCEENMGPLLPRFDVVVLLSAPLPVLLHRLATRTGNPYGSTPGQRQRVADDLAEVEPLLRRVADVEVRTDALLDDVVRRVRQALRTG